MTSILDQARIYAGSLGWDPLVKTCRHATLSLLSQIEEGRLTIVDRDGTQTICGQAGDEETSPLAQLHVVRDAFWLRLALFADMVGDVAPPPDRVDS